MHSRYSRVLLSCRCLYGPWRQRKAGPLREQFCKGALRAHLVPRNAVTLRINHLTRRRARKRSVQQQKLAAGVMRSMHRQ